MQIVLIVYYYPPINSSGGKRAEALSKYFVEFGHKVTVITPSKSRRDGEFSEEIPQGVNLIEMDCLGREHQSVDAGTDYEPMYSGRRSWKRRLKDLVMNFLGQIPDPRLPFSLSFLSPWLNVRARESLQQADIIIGSTPPWPMVLATLFCKWRFRKPSILDYRDHFSECHEMPGGVIAKWLERVIDHKLVRTADYVVCISEPMARYYNTITPNVTTILNGYDHEVINAARQSLPDRLSDQKVHIRYMGIISPGRIPHNILQALVMLRQRRPEFFNQLSFEFYGTASLVKDALEAKYPTIEDAFSFFDPVPYLDSMKKIIDADFLLFSETSSRKTLSAQGILTTKLFEYIGSGRPILADISIETLAGQFLNRCGAQHVIGQSPELFLAVFEEESFYKRHPDVVSEFSVSLSRKVQAAQYLKLISKIVETP